MKLRLCCAVSAMCLMATIASAQTGLRSASLPERVPGGPPPPPMTLPSASLPDRTSTHPSPPHRGDRFLAGPDTYEPFVDARGRPLRRFLPFGYGYVSDTYVPTGSRSGAETLPDGYLYLQMQPATAQVYVDGFYMGSVNDIRRMIPGRSLQAGAHRIEIQAPGYETRTFDVLIPPNEVITYRTDLQPIAGSVKAVAASPGVPKTFYVIPGCYAGDKPPRAKLPRGCDRSKLRVVPPQPVLSVKR
jgi:hypothetical protein